MSPDTPAFTPLPAIGSDARRNMIVAMAAAFGPPGNGRAAINPEAIYNQLSQLSYHDRITLVQEVCRHQGIRLDAVDTDPERAARMLLLNRLGHGTDQNPTFAGVNRFLHLMADAPQDARYEELLRGEILEVVGFWPRARFVGSGTEAFRVFMSGSGVTTPGNPYQRLQSIGITPGNPPLRTNAPLGVIPAPVYQTPPAVNTDARRSLVAQLVTAAGPVATGGTPFIGFQNPDTFFRLMANYTYAQRIALYREVLVAQGLNAIAVMPEENIRFHLMNRFMHNATGQKTFAGIDQFFRFVSDAPRDTAHRDLLTGEIIQLLSFTNRSLIIDRDQPGIQANYQRFFNIGGRNPHLIVADPYSRLELIGIPLGQPPVLNPLLPARDAAPPILWDRLDIIPDPSRPGRIFGFPLQPEMATCSVAPLHSGFSITSMNVHSPLAHV